MTEVPRMVIRMITLSALTITLSSCQQQSESPRGLPSMANNGATQSGMATDSAAGLGLDHSASSYTAGHTRSELSASISRQLKPYWRSPRGRDAERLVTILAWDLKPDGSLAGRPTLVALRGVTKYNSIVSDAHIAAAIQAVEHAAPFKLPVEQYNLWHHVSAFRFDRKIPQ